MDNLLFDEERSVDVICGFFFFQAEDGIRDLIVTGVQTCALPICSRSPLARATSTYSWVNTSSSDERVMRAINAAEIAPSVIDGRIRCCRKSMNPPSPRA